MRIGICCTFYVLCGSFGGNDSEVVGCDAVCFDAVTFGTAARLRILELTRESFFRITEAVDLRSFEHQTECNLPHLSPETEDGSRRLWLKRYIFSIRTI